LCDGRAVVVFAIINRPSVFIDGEMGIFRRCGGRVDFLFEGAGEKLLECDASEGGGGLGFGEELVGELKGCLYMG
jgi:hypothetical protein|tara:strand:- start:47519 stop:47743 length:225 start_codon:yes stop_codon:yes gene_type:complete